NPTAITAMSRIGCSLRRLPVSRWPERDAAAYPSSRGCSIRLVSNDMEASGRRCPGGAVVVTDPSLHAERDRPVPIRSLFPVLFREWRDGVDQVFQLYCVQDSGPEVQRRTPDRERPAEDPGEQAKGVVAVAEQQQRERVQQAERRRLAEEVHRQCVEA